MLKLRLCKKKNKKKKPTKKTPEITCLLYYKVMEKNLEKNKKYLWVHKSAQLEGNANGQHLE